MKKNIFLLLLITSFLLGFSQSKNYLIATPDIDSTLYKYLGENDNIYIVHLDFNDCINCNLALHLFSKYNTQPKAVYYSFAGVPDFKIPALIKKFDLPDSIALVKSEALKNFISNKFTVPGSRSLILKYQKSALVQYSYLKELSNYQKLETFLSNGTSPKDTKRIDEADYFYSEINQFKKVRDKFVVTTYPDGQLLLIDSNFSVTKNLLVDTAYLRDSIFPDFIATFPDSLKAINSFEDVLKSYIEDAKPLGLNIYNFGELDVLKNEIFVSSYVSLPVIQNPNKVSYTGKGFIFSLDTNLKINRTNYYEFFTGQKYLPLSMYGFKVNNDKTLEFAYTNDEIRYGETKYLYTDTVFILGKWVKSGSSYFNSYNSSKVFLLEKNIRGYLKRYKDLAIKHYHTNDSLLYFTYMPLILNKNTNQTFELLDTLLLNHRVNNLLYRNYYTFFNTITKSLSSIERIDGILYFSVFGDNYERKSMKAINITSGAVPKFHLDGSKLYCLFTKSKEGTFIGYYDISEMCKEFID